MKRYLIHCDTFWCGTQNTYRVEADDTEPGELDDLTYQKAYANFYKYAGVEDIAEEEGLDPDNPEDLEKCEDLIDEYFSYDYEEFTGTDEEWEMYPWVWE